MENTTTDTMQVPESVVALNKKIASTIRFKDRMIELNKALEEGQNENDLNMTVFEVEIRAREGNHKFIKREDGKFVKLYSWDLIKRSVEKIKKLREEKADLMAEEA